MIELRYVKVERQDGELGWTEDVLQYRWREDMGDDFYKITQWKDVPVVKEEQKDVRET